MSDTPAAETPAAFDPTPAEMQTILAARQALANAKANAEQCTAARKGAEQRMHEALVIENAAHQAHSDANHTLHVLLELSSLANVDFENWSRVQQSKAAAPPEREQWQKLHHNAIKQVAENPHLPAEQKMAMIALAAEIRAAHPDAFR